MKLFSKIKKLLLPIKYAPISWSFYFFISMYHTAQIAFIVLLSAWIINSIETAQIDKVYFYVAIFIGVQLLRYILNFISEQLNDYTSNHVQLWLMKKYFREYIRLDNTQVESYWTWKMQNIIVNWIWKWEAFISDYFITILNSIFSIIYVFIIIVWQSPSWKFVIAAIVLFVFSVGFVYIWLKLMVQTRKKSKEISIQISWNDVKILMSKYEILQNWKLESELDKQEILIKNRIKLRQTANREKYIWHILSFISNDSFRVWIYLTVWIWVIYWQYSLAYLVLIIQLLIMLSRNIWEIRNVMRRYYKIIVDIEKLREVFENIPKIDTDSWSQFNPWKCDIEIKNLSFSYNNNEVFSKFSLNIKWWTKTALVWDSWWWKSTLMKLIAGYISPNSWDIIIDKQKLSQLNLISYYKNIGYLTQDPSVFDWTIYENLTYALDYEPSDKELKNIISLSQCEFVYDFEKWLKTQIWERGVRLSGWQKQRLAIAKIMLKNPKIILLDEPTSALDSQNEELVTKALNNLFQGKTVIVIAHRLQTVKNANEILYIANWKIVERWNHEELYKLGWEYFKLVELQSGF